MKKLLLILMIAPILFISCNKDDDTPGNNNNNNNNNNNGTANFLENQDGSIWIAQPDTSNWVCGPYKAMIHALDNVRVGFFDDMNFFTVKQFDSGNPTDVYCTYFVDGYAPSYIDDCGFNVIFNIITNSPNELVFSALYDPETGAILEYKFTTTSTNSSQMILEEKLIENNVVIWNASVFYIKSPTETNLSCN